jgi:hypothetical protein
MLGSSFTLVLGVSNYNRHIGCTVKLSVQVGMRDNGAVPDRSRIIHLAEDGII